MAVILGGADKGGREGAACMRDSGSLRNGGHRHHVSDRDTDGRTDEERYQNPFVRDNLMAEQRADHGEEHAQFANEHAAACSCRRVHPFDGEDEPGGREDVENRINIIHAHACRAPLFGPRFLNILSMRSVIR